MQTIIEAKPAKPTTTHKFSWTVVVPGRGILVIDTTTGRKTRRACYQVEEFPCQFDGRAFRLHCAGGQSDDEAASYDCFVARNGQDHRCECKGFLRWAGKCKHILACLDMWDNGYLDQENPEADRGATPAEVAEAVEPAEPAIPAGPVRIAPRYTLAVESETHRFQASFEVEGDVVTVRRLLVDTVTGGAWASDLLVMSRDAARVEWAGLVGLGYKREGK